MSTKLNVLLAKTDQLGAVIKKNITDSIDQFKNKQAHFRGEKNTYKEKAPEFADPKLNVDKPVPSTVPEWLKYTSDLASVFLIAKLDQEATNCSGTAKADLVIEGVNYGTLTTGELMALKGFFEAQALKDMYAAMPTISLSERWTKSTNPEYANRAILESAPQNWTDKTTETVQEVVFDTNPNTKATTGVVINVKKTIEKADVSRQLFTGEISHIDKAAILARLTKVNIAIKAALEEANNTPVVPSSCTPDKILDYLRG